MPKKEKFLVNRIKSINYAFRGAVLLIKTEASIQIQLVIAILVTIAGFYFNLNITEWIVQIDLSGPGVPWACRLLVKP